MTVAINYLNVAGAGAGMFSSTVTPERPALVPRSNSNSSNSNSSNSNNNNIYAQTSFDTGRPSMVESAIDRDASTFNQKASIMNLTESILKDAKLFSRDPGTIDKAVFALVHWIDSELNQGSALTEEQQEVVRQVRRKVNLLIAKGFISLQRTNLNQTSDCHEQYCFGPVVCSSNDNVHQMHNLADALMSI
ncbi:MAG: hypothetical protein EKK48_19335 [Candidatus Melainabacteria bacterium]|nr:MAG: hypothetical protein EKK48_19335 [Candidatus Melainabacteria bacterium]